MIIGLTGTLSAGKGTVSEYLKNKGFKHFSVRDFLVKELNKRELLVNRDSLVFLANQLRQKHSPSYIVEQLYEQAKIAGGDSIIESIRSPGEVEKLKLQKDFYLLSVDANQKLRYRRSIERNSETDNISFEEFAENEKREMSSEDFHKQNLHYCITHSDFKLTNDGPVEDLYLQVDEILNKINKKSRLSWDEYFLEIAKVVSSRSTCDRGSSGCIIVKDRQILATGYNGSAKGLPHCDDVGHEIKTIKHNDGSFSQHCTRTIHGEQNAICQAAKFGVSLDGATLYYLMTPCTVCDKMIINCGIKRVVCEERYHRGKETEELFKQANVELKILKDDVVKYSNQ